MMKTERETWNSPGYIHQPATLPQQLIKGQLRKHYFPVITRVWETNVCGASARQNIHPLSVLMRIEKP